MDIHIIMSEFKKLGDTVIGQGPKTQINSTVKVQNEIQTFAAKYRFDERYPDYLEFVSQYAAAAIYRPDESLIMQIYGFDAEIAVHIDLPDEPVIEDDFLRFAEIIVKTGEGKADFIGGDYAFDISDSRKTGIYHRIAPSGVDSRTLSYKWYCDNFLTWLQRVVDAKGKLPLVSEYDPKG